MTVPTSAELWEELVQIIQEELANPVNSSGTVPVQFIRTQIPASRVAAALEELDRAVKDGRVIHIIRGPGMGSVRFP